ncbi:molybdenum cofactor guanylyltransferase [Cellulomonas soli]|uniref:molybdenum cofactor guanylyltransferase n=1 Tax=Cellulomonas soli TaxID=931535 RepID=UPI003F82D523
MTDFDAVVLAGGRARRLGGASKPEIPVGGRALVDHVLEATVGARRVVLVAPEHLVRPGVVTVLEDPPDGGPCAGIAAGLDALGSDPAGLVLVLACDVPLAAQVVPALLAAVGGAEPGVDGARVTDQDGRPQHLLAVYRRRALDDAVRRHGGPEGVRGLPVRILLGGLRLVDLVDPHGAADADTWDDVHRLDALLRGAGADDGTIDRSGHRPTPDDEERS